MSDATEVSTKHCKNCKRDIAESNYVIHEVHCRRNIVLCEQCHEPVPRSDLETHVKDVHAPVNCELCGSAVERNSVEQHKNDECSRRPCACEYCELIFPAEKHAEHVEYCGSRTESCSRCGRFVKLRDYKLHEESQCMLPVVTTPPASSSNEDVACSGMEPYYLSQLDHLLCHDVASSALWTCNQRANASCGGQFGQAEPMQPFVPMGRWNQSHGFAKRNHPGQFANRRDGMPTAASKNNDFINRRPKVMNGPQKGNSASAHDTDDAECNLLPCEFCCNTFPSDVLLQHQVFCGDQELNNDDPHEYGVNLLHDSDDGAPHEPDQSPSANGLSPPWLLDDTSGKNEEVMLPCEFCEALFPDSHLAFHQSNCEMARVLGAATPLVPSAHTPVPHYPKPIRRQSPWYDDPASAASRASRHQGPPVHLQHHPSSGDRVVQQGYGGIPLPVTQDTGRQRRNIGSRPGMHNRPRMHIPAAAGSRLAEQPAVSSKSGCERAESHSEQRQVRGANPRGSSINQAGRHITGAAAQPPRRLPPRSPNQPTAVNNAISQSSQGSQTVSPVPASSDIVVSHGDNVSRDTQDGFRPQPPVGSRRNYFARHADGRPPRMSVSRNVATDYDHNAEQHQESTGRPLPNSSRPRRSPKTNNRDEDTSQRYRRGNGRGTGGDH